MTAFSNALYYPTIDITNSSWLKTAVLFWDSIFTIVPESFRKPYQNRDAVYLFNEGFLKPLRVNSNDETVISIEDEFIKLLYSPELYTALYPKYINDTMPGIHASKMSLRLRREVESWLRRSEKWDYRDFEHFNREYFRDSSERQSRGGYYYIESRFTDLYMMVLAEKLSERYSLAMVTDTVFSFETGNRLRLNNEINPYLNRDRLFHRLFHGGNYIQPELKQCILLDYVINGFSIHPDCNLEDIIDFKRKHRDELGRFKNELQRLTKGIDANKPFETLSEEINNKYKNSFLPSYDGLKKALRYSRIRWATETFLKVSLFTTSATGIPMALLGMPVPIALFAGAGLSVIASSVSYDVNRRETLLNNPYSYLLSIQEEL